MSNQQFVWILLICILLFIPSSGFGYGSYYYDENEEVKDSPNGQGDATLTIKSETSQTHTINTGNDIIKDDKPISNNNNNNDNDNDSVFTEFTLTADSHINLLLWQFIIWQIGFVIVGMCLCGGTILMYEKCCR